MKNAVLNILFLVMLLAACGKGTESITNEEKISGNSEKTWKAVRETNAEGEKDKLTKEEKKESITFSRNGNVKMRNEDQEMGGTWTFSENTLSLQFTGTNVTENFRVVELSDDKMKLLAGDGSQMTLEAE